MKQPKDHFNPPGLIARAVNRMCGRLASVGLGPSSTYLLLTAGRKSGMTRSTPVNVLRLSDKLYLVGTRGHTQWSRNAAAAGTVTLKRGRIRIKVRLRVVADNEKAEILKAYLVRFKWSAWLIFPLPAESALDAFAAIAPRYPVFELLAERWPLG